VFRSVRERPTSEAGLLRAFDGRIGTVTLEELDPKTRLRNAVARIADDPIAAPVTCCAGTGHHMKNIPRHLKQLDEKLESLPDDSDAMLISELDGLVAGILVCPDLILPDEWLPLVWDSGEEDAPPVFANARQAEQLVELVMKHYNATADDLRSGCYEPVFEVDARHDEILWELWLGGFEAAIRLRPDSFAAILDGDEEEAAWALSALIQLIDIARGGDDLPERKTQELIEAAPHVIRACIKTLNASRLGRQAASRPEMPVRALKVGRNDPCPCGSGKKYKKCCGAN
jgi:uncharacterized protein